ncbi:hypothetical protein BDW66DRAFT_39885 [Aspergillus desertorum]
MGNLVLEMCMSWDQIFLDKGIQEPSICRNPFPRISHVLGRLISEYLDSRNLLYSTIVIISGRKALRRYRPVPAAKMAFSSCGSNTIYPSKASYLFWPATGQLFAPYQQARSVTLCDSGVSTSGSIDGEHIPRSWIFNPCKPWVSTEGTDIFSLGSIFYTVMTGHGPYNSRGPFLSIGKTKFTMT